MANGTFGGGTGYEDSPFIIEDYLDFAAFTKLDTYYQKVRYASVKNDIIIPDDENEILKPSNRSDSKTIYFNNHKLIIKQSRKVFPIVQNYRNTYAYNALNNIYDCLIDADILIDDASTGTGIINNSTTIKFYNCTFNIKYNLNLVNNYMDLFKTLGCEDADFEECKFYINMRGNYRSNGGRNLNNDFYILGEDADFKLCQTYLDINLNMFIKSVSQGESINFLIQSGFNSTSTSFGKNVVVGDIILRYDVEPYSGNKIQILNEIRNINSYSRLRIECNVLHSYDYFWKDDFPVYYSYKRAGYSDDISTLAYDSSVIGINVINKNKYFEVKPSAGVFSGKLYYINRDGLYYDGTKQFVNLEQSYILNYKTTSQMKDKLTYIDINSLFDFETIWGIDPSINDGFPYLLENIVDYNMTKDLNVQGTKGVIRIPVYDDNTVSGNLAKISAYGKNYIVKLTSINSDDASPIRIMTSKGIMSISGKNTDKT